jgi:tRNA(fMet)-specific endonuclease VapC
MEIEYGLARNPERARRIQPVIEALLDAITIVPCGPSEARETGRLRADLERGGRPIGPFDALIAGVARVHRLIVVSANVSEFTRVPKLDVENWRVA